MKMKINLTQHLASAEQISTGVFEPADKSRVQALLTFDELPSKELILARAESLAEIAASEKAEAAMIGGAPYLMSALESALIRRGVMPLYAFSKRESVDEPQADGSSKKVAVFRHAGWVMV